MDTAKVFEQLAEGQAEIMRSIGALDVKVEALSGLGSRVEKLEADTLRIQGAWKMLKILGIVITGGIGALGATLKLLGKL